MYVTRPLSHYNKFHESLSTPPEGPNSGFLVIQDEESETYSCFGLCKNQFLGQLPFPQNKRLTTRYVQSSGETQTVSDDEAIFIPVLNQPLSANRYYVLKPSGRHKGEAYTCSREEDMATCCFCRCVKDVKPRPFDPNNIYQQIQIAPYEATCVGKGSFHATSIASDGFPPYFLRREGWQIYTKTPKNYKLEEAPGLNTALRAQLPDFNFSTSCKLSGPIVVGKWYSPFIFVRDGLLKDQIKKSPFYQITLERNWEQIFFCRNNYSQGNTVVVDAAVEKEVAFVAGNKATWDERNVVDGAIWFTSIGSQGEGSSIGLSPLVIERMKWEQGRAGWLQDQKEKEVRVKREEDCGQIGGWKEFGCYVLVERFVLKRMDGSLAMTYEFRHTHQIRSKWE